MKKIIKELRRRGRTIITTNGARTKTAAVYVASIKDYTPLPNGFNAELANEIIETTEATQGRLWRQDHWREFLSGYEIDEQMDEAMSSLNPALTAVESYDRCGTTMCVAGWVGELTGADWVVDLSLGKKGRTSMDDYVLVRKDSIPDQIDLSRVDKEDPWSVGGYAKALDKRGFSPETHVCIEISVYAKAALGIGSDPLMLFDGDNTWWKVRGIVDAYTMFGADFAWEDRAQVYAVAYGRNEATLHFDVDRVDAFLATLEEEVGYDYRRRTAPQWALEMVGEAVHA